MFPGTFVPQSDIPGSELYEYTYKLSHIMRKLMLKPIYTEDGVFSLEFESTWHCSK